MSFAPCSLPAHPAAPWGPWRRGRSEGTEAQPHLGSGCRGWGGKGGGNPAAAAAGGGVSAPQHTNCPAASWTCDQTLQLCLRKRRAGWEVSKDIQLFHSGMFYNVNIYSTDVWRLGSDLITLHKHQAQQSREWGVKIITSLQGKQTQSQQVDAGVEVWLLKCYMNSSKWQHSFQVSSLAASMANGKKEYSTSLAALLQHCRTSDGQ